MKAKEIKDLIDFIASSGLDEVNIETDEFKLHVKKQTDNPSHKLVDQIGGQAAPQPQQTSYVTQPAQDTTEKQSAKTTGTDDGSDKYITIKSPMIGTFYRSPNPEAEAFFNVGDRVNVGDVVCIIEAMKLFNEIESEVSGKIVKVLVDNASPVEYDQPLYLVDPS